jgi:hypothetical protein
VSFCGKAVLPRLCRDQSGQILPMVAVMLVVLLGMTGLVLDLGRVYLSLRELQSSADASALAGATAMAGATTHPLATTVSGVEAYATNYSSVSGNHNAYNNLSNVTMASGYPLLKCLATFQAQGISCVGFVPYNAVQVKLQSTVPMYFARLFGVPTMTIGATATAVKGGGPARPYNVAIIVDSTGTMRSPDWNCDPSGNTSKLMCSLQGVRVLLQNLNPCGTSQPTCTVTAGNAVNSVARVSIFTFPQLMYTTVSNDYNCGNSPPTSTVYSYPAAGAVGYNPGTSSNGTTFRVIDFQSDYRTSDTSTSLNTASLLTIAAGGKPGCNGITAPDNITYDNTYYPPPMYAAEAALLQEQEAYPGSENIMIIVGDGDANTAQTSGSTVIMPSPATANAKYPSWLGECSQAVTAAQSFTSTVVYTVAYGSPTSGGCVYDQDAAFSPKANISAYPNIEPCGELEKMATYSWTFFSDYLQSGSTGNCIAPQSMTALSDIFLQIAGDLTEARLVSDNTT